MLRDGRVRASVPESWVQLFDRSGGKVALFQIKNPADEGTPDAANVALVVTPKWPSVQAAAEWNLNSITSTPGGVIVSDEQGPKQKRVILARGQIEATPYVIMVVIGMEGDLVVVGHTAYPLLEGTTSEWYDALIGGYKAMLSSIRVDGVAVFPGKDPTSTADRDYDAYVD